MLVLIALTLGRSWTTDQRRRDALRGARPFGTKLARAMSKCPGPSGMLVRQGCVKASKSLPRRIMPPPIVRRVSNGVYRSVKRPIELHDFNALPHRQLLTLHFITTHVLAEYLKNGKAFHEFLYSQQHNASVLIATPLPSLHAIHVGHRQTWLRVVDGWHYFRMRCDCFQQQQYRAYDATSGQLWPFASLWTVVYMGARAE